MIRTRTTTISLALALLAASAGGSEGEPSDRDRQWPMWRGPLATGEAPHADPPIEWSETSNVRFKVAIPGLGHSTPVVWGSRIYLTSAEPFGERLEPRIDHVHGAHDGLAVTQKHRFLVLALDRDSGEIVWRRAVHEELPHEGGHVSGSMASASPVTDGERVFAFFGSRGLYALDDEGRVLWQTDLGEMKTKHAHGEGASPALWDDTLVVNWDHEGPSFLVAFDAATGKERWRTERDEPSSWSTPLIVPGSDEGGKTQVVVAATNRVRGYDLATGEVLWESAGLSGNVVASPVAADGILVAGSSYDFQAMVAIELTGASGDVTGTGKVLWTRSRGTPYVPSPLLVDGSLYFFHHYQSILSRVDLETGAETTGPFRLRGARSFYASPVAAAGRVYVTDLAGTTLVLSDEPTPKVLAVNRLDESVSASAALVGDEILLRGRQHLYSLARAESGEAESEQAEAAEDAAP